jgi:lipoprotein-releasing system permease protein
MLSIVPHIEIRSGTNEPLTQWKLIARQCRQLRPDIIGSAPFVRGQALIAKGDSMQGVYLRGIDPLEEAFVTPLIENNPELVKDLQPGRWNILLGIELARQLGVEKGSRISVVTPQGKTTAAGVLPRFKTFRVAGLFDSGHFEYDSAMALINIDDAAKLMRTGGPNGIQLRLENGHDAREAGEYLSAVMPSQIIVSDWTRTNRNWFDAVQLEKRLMFIILTLIVAVAAFNLVSTLVMTVTDKTSDIAILRTMGASPQSIMTIFMLQGATAGLMGTISGLVMGLIIAFNVGSIVSAIEQLLSTHFLPASVYLISRMPSDPQWRDIAPITLISLILAFIATIYPSWRASRVQPAQALRYE